MDTIKKQIECPICGGKLLEGYIQVPSVSLAWSHASKKKSMITRLYYRVDEDEIRLSKWSWLFGSKVLANNCSNCRTIFIKY